MNSNENSKEIDLSSLDSDANEIGIGGDLAPEREEEGYRQRMQRRKEVQLQRLQKRDQKKGLILIFTGHGKGKTTAALGLALRTLGHGESVAIVQFIKGAWEPGEAKALKVFGDSLSWHALGGGFTWETQDRDLDKQLVSNAWEKSKIYLRSQDKKLVILDEINIAMRLGYLSVNEVLAGIKTRPPLTHVALTGRDAPKELIEHADLVTEMKLVHHPFKEQGIKAQSGIEF